VGRQVVLTGGGAELKGMADYVQSVLGRAVRVGRPRGLIGLPDAHSGPGFATLAGLIHYAASDPIDVRGMKTLDQQVYAPIKNGLLEKLITAFKTSF